MRVFPDTSFLCALYRQQETSPRAIRFMEKSGGGLAVSSLVLFEFRQSVRLQEWLYRGDRTKGVSGKQGQAMLSDLRLDLASGVLALQAVDWALVHGEAERLSATHTKGGGHRFADLLHVATALTLGAEGFVSFDRKQRALAESEGMALVV